MTGGFVGEGWEIRPMPILFALPSRPIAIIVEVSVEMILFRVFGGVECQG
jgi:hypothetical protein